MRHRGARALSLQGRGLRDGLQVVRRRRSGSRAQPLRAGQRHGGFLCQEGPGGGGSAARVLGRVPAQEDGRPLPLQMGESMTTWTRLKLLLLTIEINPYSLLIGNNLSQV